MSPQRRAAGDLCHHALSDQTTLTFSVVTRDLMDGSENAEFGYFCPLHRRMGIHRVKRAIPVSGAVMALLNQGGIEDD